MYGRRRPCMRLLAMALSSVTMTPDICCCADVLWDLGCDPCAKNAADGL